MGILLLAPGIESIQSGESQVVGASVVLRETSESAEDNQVIRNRKRENMAKDFMSEAKEKMNEAAKHAGEMKDDVEKKVGEMGERVEKAGKDAGKKAEQTAEDLKEKAKEGVDSAKDFLGGIGK